MLCIVDDEMSEVVCDCFGVADRTDDLILGLDFARYGEKYVSWYRVTMEEAHGKQGW